MNEQIYSQEFDLNLNQIKKGEIKEPMQVSYSIENCAFVTIIIPFSYAKGLGIKSRK
jgi:hypothetical protein